MRKIVWLFILLFLVIIVSNASYADWQTPIVVTVSHEGGQTSKLGKYGDNVYVLNTDTDRNLKFYKSTDGGNSFNAGVVLGPTVRNGTELEMKVGSNGSIHIFYEEDSDGIMYYRRSTDNGNTFSSSVSLTSGMDWADSPHCFIKDSNNIYLIFRAHSSPRSELYFVKSTDGGASFGTPTGITSNSIQEDQPRLVVFNNIVYVAYLDYYGTQNLYLIKSTDGGVSFSNTVRINQTDKKTDFGFEMDIDSNGNIFIPYKDTVNDYEGDLYVARSTDGGNSFDYTMAADSTYRYQEYPVIAVFNDVIYLSWYDHSDNNGEVYLTRSTDSGDTYETNYNISEDSNQQTIRSIEVDSAGVFLVATDYGYSPYATMLYMTSYATATPSLSPVSTPIVTTPVNREIAGGGFHSIALKSEGTVWAWGRNAVGELGDGSTTDSNTPIQVNNIDTAISVVCGRVHSLALKSDGTVLAWGYNASGQLGDGTNTDRDAPVQVSSITDIIAIASGWSHSVAVESNGTVWTWGNNTFGQLGDGTSTNRNTSVRVNGISDVISAACGYAHTIALKTDGTVLGWGSNQDGQLGEGTSIGTNNNTPLQITNLSNVTAIAAGYAHSLALKLDGTVWAWGNNSSGQLGNGSTADYSETPVQVNGLSDITMVASAGGASHNLALKSNGTVWTWGYNEYGQLGDGTTTNMDTPVQVSGLSDVVAIGAGDSHSLAVKSDGTVWAWGSNGEGQLGDGTKATNYTPVEVSNLNLYQTTTDNEAPNNGSLTIHNGDTYTNSTSVTLSLSATDDTGVTGYYVSESSPTPSASISGWTPVTSTTSYSADVSYTLSRGDGSKTVYVWYKDAAGNVSNSASDSITLDTTVPTVTITSPTSGSTYTTSSSSISLSGSASDATSGINSIMWSKSSTGESGMASGTTSWYVSSISLSYGSNSITITATDNVGNIATDSIAVTYSAVQSSPTPTPITPIATTTPTVTSIPCTDPFEPNDNFDSAYGPITSGESYEGKICSPLDKDYYKFEVNDNVYIEFELNVPSDRDYDLYLYDFEETVITSSNFGTGNTETITQPLFTAGTYYIGIIGYEGDYDEDQTYTLSGTWTVSRQTPTPTVTPSVTPTPGETGVIIGTVVDADTSSPIANATVSTDTGGYTTTTNPSGRYTLTNIEVGDYALTATASGYASSSQSITVVADVPTQVDFGLSPLISPTPTPVTPEFCEIYGFVTDEDYKDLKGVSVSINGENYNNSTKTDEDGYFEFTDLVAGKYTIIFEKKGYKRQTQEVSLEEGEEYDMGTIVMEQGFSGKIYGTVTDTESEPIESAKVKLKSKGNTTNVKRKGKTDNEGFFEFDELEDGTYIIQANKKGYKKSKTRVKLEDGEEEEVEIILEEK